MKKNITLADIGGYEAEKKEISQLINFIKNYDEYTSLGAVLPRGAIFIGLPGVGKTLFANAIANEAGVPLVRIDSESICGSDTPITAAINQAFDEASTKVPCILLIDEIDKLLPESGPFTPASERDRDILSVLLTRIDGSQSSDGIFVIATANCHSFDELPDSLIRAGRLEKKIRLNAPDLEARKKILSLYMNRPIFARANVAEIAKRTRGFTGAMLARLTNEVLIDAISEGKKLVHDNDFMPRLHSIVSDGLRIDPKKRRNVAPVCYHELGHFLTGYLLRGDIGSVTIEAYGDVGGMYLRRDAGKDDGVSEEDVRKEITICLAGLAATEVMLGQKYLGAASDISSATRSFEILAANGCVGFAAASAARDRGVFPSPAKTALSNQKEVYFEKCYQDACDMIRDNKEFMEKAYTLLMKHKTLSAAKMRELVRKFALKKPQKQMPLPYEERGQGFVDEEEAQYIACGE